MSKFNVLFSLRGKKFWIPFTVAWIFGIITECIWVFHMGGSFWDFHFDPYLLFYGLTLFWMGLAFGLSATVTKKEG